MKHLIFAILLILSQAGLSKSVDTRTRAFFEAMEEGDIKSAITFRTSGTGDAVDAKDNELKLQKFFGDLVASKGNFRRQELIAKKRVGKNIEVRVYMLNHKEGPARLVLVFYKSVDGWILKHLHLDEDFGKAFAESLKNAF